MTNKVAAVVLCVRDCHLGDAQVDGADTWPTQKKDSYE